VAATRPPVDGNGRHAACACWLTSLSASFVSVSSVFFSSASVASSSFTACYRLKLSEPVKLGVAQRDVTHCVDESVSDPCKPLRPLATISFGSIP
jgi:hypothetical protein